jgi:hypothetical protein
VKSPHRKLQRGGFWQVALLAVAVCAASASPARACVGDCNGDGEVTIDEILLGVSITLGTRPLVDCPRFDRNNDGEVTIDELLEAVNNALSGCPVEPVFPANYRDTFVEVRDCRLSIEHGGVSIRVLANPISVRPYQEERNPLPVGSVIVKEEYAGPDCDDDRELVRWRVMRKEMPGFDPEDGDWHWQWVEPDRSVLFDDKATCISCHRQPECVARDYMCTEEAEHPRGALRRIFDGLASAFLGVAGTSADDVYVVGSDRGEGPAVLHYDGDRWTRLRTDARGDLWWISVEPIDGKFYMCGSGGLILEYDPASRTFTRHETPGDDLLLGIWGTAADNLWAVGEGGIWRFDGETWTIEDVSTVRPQGIPTLNKVWGRSADDVYVVGERGVILNYDGNNWAEVESDSVRPLITIHGNGTHVVAVGGFFTEGVILELEGSAFRNRTPAGAPQMNGVFLPLGGEAVAVGWEGSLALRTSSGWQLRDTRLNTFKAFHAAWVDPEGGIWAVGGDLIVGDLQSGIIAYGGSRFISNELVDQCPAGGMNSGATTVSYAQDIAPLLTQSGCMNPTCHSGLFLSSNFDLGSYESGFEPGDQASTFNICPIVPGNPGASYLIEKLGPTPREGVQMPNSFPPLNAEQIELISTWILEGAANN